MKQCTNPGTPLNNPGDSITSSYPTQATLLLKVLFQNSLSGTPIQNTMIMTLLVLISYLAKCNFQKH